MTTAIIIPEPPTAPNTEPTITDTLLSCFSLDTIKGVCVTEAVGVMEGLGVVEEDVEGVIEEDGVVEAVDVFSQLLNVSRRNFQKFFSAKNSPLESSFKQQHPRSVRTAVNR